MRVIRKINDEIKEVEYPHIDISEPVKGLGDGILYYFINQAERPSYNADKSYLKPTEELTTNKHPEYSHLLLCERGWEVVDYPQQVIVEKLNSSLGEHLDYEYPLWERQKHSDELLIGSPDADRKTYIESLKMWEFSQRQERDNRENEYLTNGVFPSFAWEPRPEKI